MTLSCHKYILKFIFSSIYLQDSALIAAFDGCSQVLGYQNRYHEITNARLALLESAKIDSSVVVGADILSGINVADIYSYMKGEVGHRSRPGVKNRVKAAKSIFARWKEEDDEYLAR